MLQEGHQWLRQLLLEEEKAMASPFSSAGLGVATEISRMQAIIDSFQGELARLRGSSAVGYWRKWRRIDVRVATCQEVHVGKKWQHALLGFDFRCSVGSRHAEPRSQKRRLVLMSSRTVASAIDSPDNHEERFQRVRRAICGRNELTTLRAALTLDTIVLPEQLKKRPSVMKSVPHFLKRPFAMLCGWHWRQCQRMSFGMRGVVNCCYSSHAVIPASTRQHNIQKQIAQQIVCQKQVSAHCDEQAKITQEATVKAMMCRRRQPEPS